jgi:hypothetical protein
MEDFVALEPLTSNQTSPYSSARAGTWWVGSVRRLRAGAILERRAESSAREVLYEAVADALPDWRLDVFEV